MAATHQSGGAPPAAAAAAASSSSLRSLPSRDASDVLSLANIRQTLIRLEDTIIFGLIERAQFARNDAVYEPEAVPVPGFRSDGRRYSLLEYLLRETEQVRSACWRVGAFAGGGASHALCGMSLCACDCLCTGGCSKGAGAC